MNRNKLLLLFFLLNTSNFLLAQEISANLNSINQAVIRDAVGDVQIRSILTPTWMPITAGVKIYENSFIRLNSPNSIITISLPTGALLRLIGIGSFYIDYLSRPKNETYQTKLLVMSGRWFYSGNINSPERMIINTDITTSIVENGSGGGYFYNGTNEFVIRTGRGLISYRQAGVKALVLDERQVVNFNTLDGFFHPKLATKKLFENYIIFNEQESIETPTFNTIITNQSSTESNLSQIKHTNKQFLIAHSEDLTNIITELQNKPLVSNEINIMQLKVLEDLVFQKRSDLLQVVISDTTTIEEEKEEIEYPKEEKVPPVPVIPKRLLQDINVDDFTIAENLPTMIEKEEKPKTPARPQRPKRPARIKTKPNPEPISVPQEAVQKDTQEPDIDTLIKELETISAEEKPSINQQEIDSRQNKRRRRRVQTPSIEITEVQQKPLPLSPEQLETAIISPEVETSTKPERGSGFDLRQQRPGANIQQEAEKTPQFPLPNMTYQAPDSYFNTNPESLEYDQFEIDTIQDLMDSDFASVLLN